MKVVIWEKDVLETVGSLSKMSDKYDCVVVSSEDELFSELDDEQLMVVILDMDLKIIDVDKISETLINEFPSCKRILVSEKKGPKEFKKHQRSKLKADGYLKRPYDIDYLADILADFYQDFIKDSPADMGGKGGTLDLNIGSATESVDDDQGEPAIDAQQEDITGLEFHLSGDSDEVQDIFDSAQDGTGINLKEKELSEDDQPTMILDLGALKKEMGQQPEVDAEISFGDSPEESNSSEIENNIEADGLEFSLDNSDSSIEDAEEEIDFSTEETESGQVEIDQGEDIQLSMDDGDHSQAIEEDESDDISFNVSESPSVDIQSVIEEEDDGDSFSLDDSDSAEGTLDLQMTGDTTGDLDLGGIQGESQNPEVELPGQSPDILKEQTIATTIEQTADISSIEDHNIDFDVSSVGESDEEHTFATQLDTQSLQNIDDIEGSESVEFNIEEEVPGVEIEELDMTDSYSDSPAQEDTSGPSFEVGTGAKEFQMPDLEKKQDDGGMIHKLPRGLDLSEDDQETEIVDTASLQIQQPPQTMTSSKKLHELSDELREHHSDEILRLQVTISNLREDREKLILDNTKLEEKLADAKFDNNGIRAELEELKIESKIMRKKYMDEIEEMRYSIKLTEEKKIMLEEKNKHYRQELERLNQKVHVNIRKIQEREKQLEGQLELLKADSENVVKTRDSKILELKRQIDSMEFAMETMSAKEKKLADEKSQLEDRLESIVKTLRTTIGNLDEDILVDFRSSKKYEQA